MGPGGAPVRVLVVGGSLAGLNAAARLAAAGCDVRVFERSASDLEGRGAGIVLHPETVRLPAERGAFDVDGLSVPADTLRYLAPDGSVAAETSCRYRFTSYTSLYRSFRELVEEDRHHLGRECVEVEVEARPGGVHVRFADGGEARGDLVVGADGVNSTVRRLLLPDVRARYAGYVAWRGTVEEGELPELAFAALGTAITYHLRPDGHVLAYPIPGEPGQGRLNWLWYRNVPEGPELEDLLTGRDGGYTGTSVPPGRVRVEHLDRLRAQAGAQLAPVLAQAVTASAQPFLQAIADLAVPRTALGRACLIGDAAFALRPHVAAGSAKAADDGRALADALRGKEDVEPALRAWEAGRLDLGRRLLARARDAGARLQSGRWRAGEPLPFGLREAGDSAMA